MIKLYFIDSKFIWFTQILLCIKYFRSLFLQSILSIAHRVRFQESIVWNFHSAARLWVETREGLWLWRRETVHSLRCNHNLMLRYFTYRLYVYVTSFHAEWRLIGRRVDWYEIMIGRRVVVHDFIASGALWLRGAYCLGTLRPPLRTWGRTSNSKTFFKNTNFCANA